VPRSHGAPLPLAAAAPAPAPAAAPATREEIRSALCQHYPHEVVAAAITRNSSFEACREACALHVHGILLLPIASVEGFHGAPLAQAAAAAAPTQQALHDAVVEALESMGQLYDPKRLAAALTWAAACGYNDVEHVVNHMFGY